MAHDNPAGDATTGRWASPMAAMARFLPWRWRSPAVVARDLEPSDSGTLTTRLVGQFSSALFLPCGLCVSGAGLFHAFPPWAYRTGLIAAGLVTEVCGASI